MPAAHTGHATELRTLALADHGEPLPLPVLDEIAETLHTCCGHSRLKSARLARGWSVPRAVDELTAAGAAAELSERGIDERRWRRWEAGLQRRAEPRSHRDRRFPPGVGRTAVALALTDSNQHAPESAPYPTVRQGQSSEIANLRKNLGHHG